MPTATRRRPDSWSAHGHLEQVPSSRRWTGSEASWMPSTSTAEIPVQQGPQLALAAAAGDGEATRRANRSPHVRPVRGGAHESGTDVRPGLTDRGLTRPADDAPISSRRNRAGCGIPAGDNKGEEQVSGPEWLGEREHRGPRPSATAAGPRDHDAQAASQRGCRQVGYQGRRRKSD